MSAAMPDMLGHDIVGFFLEYGNWIERVLPD